MSKLYNKILPQLVLVGIVIVSTLLVWLPFLLKSPTWFGLPIPNSNFEYILRHFDGPLYVVPAKTLYNPQAIANLGIELPLSTTYFAAHIPLYPLAIKLFAPIFGYLKSMVFVTVLFTSFLAILFYEVVKRLKLSKNPFLLSVVFLFLPRFLVLRTVGAPETMFMFFILGSLFFFEKNKYFWSGLLGGLAAATKTPGVLLFVVYGLTLLERYLKTKKFENKTLWLLLIPVGLLSVFLFYLNQTGDFFAYFNSGDNIHLVAPYAAFNHSLPWVGTGWLEDIVFYFFLYISAVFTLKNSKYRSFFYFALVFTLAVIFVQHRDIARYSIPLWMMACVAFERFFTSKKFLYVFILLLPAIFMYAWNFSLVNIMPISNWAPYL